MALGVLSLGWPAFAADPDSNKPAAVPSPPPVKAEKPIALRIGPGVSAYYHRYDPNLLKTRNDVRAAFMEALPSSAYWGFNQIPSGFGFNRFDGTEQTRIAAVEISDERIALLSIPDRKVGLIQSLPLMKTYYFAQLQKPIGGFQFVVATGPAPGIQNAPYHYLLVNNERAAKLLVDAFASLAEAAAGTHKFAVPPPPFGIGARELSEAEKQSNKITGGVFVGSVDAKLAAAQLDVRVGDIIVAANGKDVAGLDALQAILSAEPVRSVRVLRDGVQMNLVALRAM